MPFRQPTQLTIRACYFRGNAFSFPVASVLPAEQAGKQLIMTPSVGYLLTTSVHPKPQPQQTLPYSLQADGSCLAQATVTLLADGPALVNGTVTLHDPLGATTVLKISIETELFLESPALTFVQSESGEQVTHLLKITQQGAQTPVALSTDKPNQFSLAIGHNPQRFTPTLTFTPVFDGTDVHVRYTPTGFGWHTACLTAKTPYTTQTVALQGQVDWPLIWETQIRQLPVTRVRKWAMLTTVTTLTMLIVSALTYRSYVHRHPLNPNLGHSPNVKPALPLPNPVSVHNHVHAPLVRIPDERPVNNSGTLMSLDTNIDGSNGNGAEKRKSPYIPRLVQRVTVSKPSKLDKLMKAWSLAQPDPRGLRPTPIELAKGADESELEQELNQTRSRKHFSATDVKRQPNR